LREEEDAEEEEEALQNTTEGKRASKHIRGSRGGMEDAIPNEMEEWESVSTIVIH